MREGDAGAVWLLPNLYKSEIERKEIWRRIGKKNRGVPPETEEIEIKINVEPSFGEHIDCDGEIGGKLGARKDKENTENENKEEKCEWKQMICFERFKLLKQVMICFKLLTI